MNLNGEQAAKIQKFLEEHQGGISKDEFVKAMVEKRGVDSGVAEAIFNHLDKSHSGHLSHEQLKEMIERIKVLANVSEEQRAKIRENIMEHMNQNDGKITKEAFLKAVSEKHNVSGDLADIIFSSVDQGHKGFLNIDDLKAVLARRAQ